MTGAALFIIGVAVGIWFAAWCHRTDDAMQRDVDAAVDRVVDQDADLIYQQLRFEQAWDDKGGDR